MCLTSSGYSSNIKISECEREGGEGERERGRERGREGGERERGREGGRE